MDDGSFGALWRVHGHYIAAFDVEGAQGVGEAAARLAHLPERVGRGVTFVILIVERDRSRLVERTLETIEGDVVVRRNLPAVTCRRVREALCALDGQLFQSGHGRTTSFCKSKLGL